jgi:hypothetical protein
MEKDKKITPRVAKFLLYITEGIEPQTAVELATIDFLRCNKCFEKILESAKMEVFTFMHPEVPNRIKLGANLLRNWYLNFEALKPGELKEITEYLDEFKKYFNEP